jgi:hypothetical protein
VNAEQAGNYLVAALSSAVISVVVPLVILGFLLGGVRRMLMEARDRPDGFIARALQDDNGKPSSDRVAKLVALAVTSWMAAVVTLTQPQLMLETLALYLAGWGAVDVTKHWLSNRPGATPPETK